MTTGDEAPGLSDRARFTLVHCSGPMRFRGNNVTWRGKPGQGAQVTVSRYSCDDCAATLELHLTEPDQPEAAT